MMPRKWAVALLVAACAGSLTTGASAQNVRGFIFSEASSGPLEGVLVRLMTPDMSQQLDSATTDLLGRFSFRASGPAEYVAIAELEGHLAAPQPFEVSALPLAIVSVTISMVAQNESQAGDGDAGSEIRNARIRGKVVDGDSGDGVEGVLVVELATGGQALTRFDGRFDLGDVPPGIARVRTEMIGYAERDWAVEVEPGSDYEAIIPIHQEAIQLAGIDVTVRSRAVARRLEPVFERMERSLGGRFLTATDFKRRGYQTVGATIQGLPSVAARQAGLRWVVRFRRGVTNFEAGCDPEVWIDGIRAAKSGAYADDLFAINTSELEIIEIYPSSVSIPPEYGAGAMCAIGIWTKRGG